MKVLLPSLMLALSFIARMMNQNGRDPMSTQIEEPWFETFSHSRDLSSSTPANRQLILSKTITLLP